MDGLAKEFAVADSFFVVLAAAGVCVDLPEVLLFGGGLVGVNGAG